MDARRILKGHVADKPRLLLVIQEERAVGNADDQVTALVGLEVAQRSHGAYYTIFPTPAPPLTLNHWGLPINTKIPMYLQRLNMKSFMFVDVYLSRSHVNSPFQYLPSLAIKPSIFKTPCFPMNTANCHYSIHSLQPSVTRRT